MQNPRKERNDPPTEDVMNLKSQGFNNNQIINKLKDDKYGFDQISSALNQAEIKRSVGSDAGVPPELSNAPSPTPSPQQGVNPLAFSEPPQTAGNPLPPQGATTTQPIRSEPVTQTYSEPTQGFAPEPVERASYSMMEEIAESIVKEKWEDMISNVGDLKVWKEKVDTDILSIKQEILRTQQRFENVQKAVLGKIKEYDKSVGDVTSEMKALEKVLEKILSPLSRNIRELSKITQELKKVR